MTRVLAVDPGDVRIGLAISDPSGTIARPLSTLAHISRKADAAAILRTASEQEAVKIVVGVAYDEDGTAGPQARKAIRLIALLEESAPVPIIPWDESGSTEEARRLNASMNDLDARAAAIILQEYLDATRT